MFFSGFFFSPAKPLLRIPAEIPGKEATLKTGSTISFPAWAQKTLKTRNSVHFPGLSLSPPARKRHFFNGMSFSLCWMNISSCDDNHVGTWTSGKGSSRSCQAQAFHQSCYFGGTDSASVGVRQSVSLDLILAQDILALEWCLWINLIPKVTLYPWGGLGKSTHKAAA